MSLPVTAAIAMTAAWASPPGDAPPLPRLTQLSTQATLLAGAEAAGGLGPVEELRLHGGRSTLTGALRADLYGATTLTAWGFSDAADRSVLDASLRGDAGVGGAMGLQGSVAYRWVELAPALEAQSDLRRGWLRLRLGPAARLGQAGWGAGLGVTALALADPSPRVDIGARVDLRGFRGDLPSLFTEADGLVQVQLGRRLDLLASAGISAAPLAVEDKDRANGVPASGTTSLRAGVALVEPLGPRVALRQQLSGDLTFTAEERSPWASLTVGVTVGLGRTRLEGSFEEEPAAPAIRIHAPEADRVEVIGDFNGWTPQPLRPEGDGVWASELELPPGRYEYVLLVDGAPTLPPDAPMTVEDGFGGRNAILVVP